MTAATLSKEIITGKISRYQDPWHPLPSKGVNFLIFLVDFFPLWLPLFERIPLLEAEDVIDIIVSSIASIPSLRQRCKTTKPPSLQCREFSATLTTVENSFFLLNSRHEREHRCCSHSNHQTLSFSNRFSCSDYCFYRNICNECLSWQSSCTRDLH